MIWIIFYNIFVASMVYTSNIIVQKCIVNTFSEPNKYNNTASNNYLFVSTIIYYDYLDFNFWLFVSYLLNLKKNNLTSQTKNSVYLFAWKKFKLSLWPSSAPLCSRFSWKCSMFAYSPCFTILMFGNQQIQGLSGYGMDLW